MIYIFVVYLAKISMEQDQKYEETNENQTKEQWNPLLACLLI